jgi:hypothetical protein
MKRKNTTSVQSTSNAAIIKNGKIYGVFYSYTDYVINGLNNSKSNYTKKQKLNAAIQNDWIDADGNEFTFEQLMGTNSIMEGDHIDARANGNETTIQNLVIRNKTSNIRKSNKAILK